LSLTCRDLPFPARPPLPLPRVDAVADFRFGFGIPEVDPLAALALPFEFPLVEEPVFFLFFAGASASFSLSLLLLPLPSSWLGARDLDRGVEGEVLF